MRPSPPAAISSLPLVRFSLLDGVSHGVSTRHGGVSPAPYSSLNLSFSTDDAVDHVRENRRRLAESLDTTPERLVVGRLVHGREVTILSSARCGHLPTKQVAVRVGASATQTVFLSDAAVSDVRGLHLLITSADCVPILFADPRRGVVGAAHAGWRGTAQGIAPTVVGTMREAFGSDPRDIVAGIGPSIGACCYPVGSEVVDTFRQHGLQPVLAETADLRLDLWASNVRQLVDSGVPEDAIEVAGVCTSCRVDHFFSYRAERGKTGRFAACIGLPEAAASR